MQNQNQQPLDPSILALTKAIGQSESSGSYTAKGKSGEYGAYQYTAPTWASDSQKYLGQAVPLEQSTPAQQDEVAYKKVQDLGKQGYKPDQIASIWNSGKPDYQGNIGTNSYGVKYDTPAYVKSVGAAYQKIMAGQPVTADPSNPSSVASQPAQQSQQSQQGNPADVQAAAQYGSTFFAKTGEGPLAAGLKAVGNLPSSFLNFGKGLVSAVAHPVKTAEGLGNAAIGAAETAGNKIAGNDTFDNNQTKTFAALTDVLKQRYGSLENAQRTATDDPFGAGADALSILEGGAGLLDKLGGTAAVDSVRGAQLAAQSGMLGDAAKDAAAGQDLAKGGLYGNALEGGLSKIADAATSPVKGLFNAGYKLGTGIAGKALGVEGGTLRQGISAAIDGGDAYKAFTEGLKGTASQSDLVDQARNALGEIENVRGRNYQDMLSTLKADPSTYDISPVMSDFEKQLDRFGIKKTSEGLDFSRSTISDSADIGKINNIYEDLKSWGTKPGDRTAIGIDTLKRRLGNYYSPTSDIRAMTSSLRDSTKGVLEAAPGYTDAMKEYAGMSDQITDIKKGLSLGDNAMVETSFKKLTGAFRQNNEFRAQLIKELDAATGGKLLPQIAGQQLSSWTPRGLVGTLEGAGGIASLMSGGTGVVPLLFTAMATSPKAVGTLIRSLKLPAAAASTIMDLLNRGAEPAILAGTAANRGLIQK